jgi:aspartate 1-decarboxylase
MSTCRSCGATVEWVVTAKGSRMPLDIQTPPGKGNIVVDNGIARAVKVGEGVRISHFATCPNAAKHRSPKTGRLLP